MYGLAGGVSQAFARGTDYALSADGAARRGPSVYDQPAFEVRPAASGIGYEARRAAR